MNQHTVSVIGGILDGVMLGFQFTYPCSACGHREPVISEVCSACGLEQYSDELTWYYQMTNDGLPLRTRKAAARKLAASQPRAAKFLRRPVVHRTTRARGGRV